MDAPERTYVRLSSANRIQIDKMRRHHAWSRDRLVNQIVAEYLDRTYEELRPSHRKRRAA